MNVSLRAGGQHGTACGGFRLGHNVFCLNDKAFKCNKSLIFCTFNLINQRSKSVFLFFFVISFPDNNVAVAVFSARTY